MIEIAQMPLGVDVSNWQQSIDWPAVAASGIVFSFAKCSEGTGFTDPYFAANWAGMKANRIMRGAYHYAKPDGHSPEDEAAYCVAIVQAAGLEPGDMIALDLEEGSGNLGDWTLRWLRRVETLVGFRPLLYTSPGFVFDHGLSGTPELANYGLWGASWDAPNPPAPPPWPFSTFWQFSSKGQVSGIAGAVDMNRFNGPAERIPLLGKPGAVPPEPLPPVPPVTVQSGPFAGMTLDQLQAKAEGLLGALAYICDNVVADQDKAQTAEAQRVREEQIGVRP